jgi:hypothetical protein
VSSTNVEEHLLETGICMQKTGNNPCLPLCSSINSKWIKNLSMRPETLNLVQERAENTLELIAIGNDFLNKTQVAKQLREMIDNWDYLKLKRIYFLKKRNGL